MKENKLLTLYGEVKKIRCSWYDHRRVCNSEYHNRVQKLQLEAIISTLLPRAQYNNMDYLSRSSEFNILLTIEDYAKAGPLPLKQHLHFGCVFSCTVYLQWPFVFGTYHCRAFHRYLSSASNRFKFAIIYSLLEFAYLVCDGVLLFVTSEAVMCFQTTRLQGTKGCSGSRRPHRVCVCFM